MPFLSRQNAITFIVGTWNWYQRGRICCQQSLPLRYVQAVLENDVVIVNGLETCGLTIRLPSLTPIRLHILWGDVGQVSLPKERDQLEADRIHTILERAEKLDFL